MLINQNSDRQVFNHLRSKSILSSLSTGDSHKVINNDCPFEHDIALDRADQIAVDKMLKAYGIEYWSVAFQHLKVNIVVIHIYGLSTGDGHRVINNDCPFEYDTALDRADQIAADKMLKAYCIE
jgi:hypothetical protein